VKGMLNVEPLTVFAVFRYLALNCRAIRPKTGFAGRRPTFGTSETRKLPFRIRAAVDSGANLV
jgi:hypothetical protein